MKVYKMTKEGKEALEVELEHLTITVRKEIDAAIKFAKSNGDLSENADYSAALEARSTNETRIAEIEDLLTHCEIVEAKAEEISIGSKVKICYLEDGEPADEEEIFTIVGAAEADIVNNKISNESPLGSALIGHKKGDVISFLINGQPQEYKIVEYPVD